MQDGFAISISKRWHMNMSDLAPDLTSGRCHLFISGRAHCFAEGLWANAVEMFIRLGS